jgi:hypothetical protein
LPFFNTVKSCLPKKPKSGAKRQKKNKKNILHHFRDKPARAVGATWEPNDISYLRGFLGKEWAAKLQSLQKGEFVYQCRDKTELIKTEVFGEHAKLKCAFAAKCLEGENWFGARLAWQLA